MSSPVEQAGAGLRGSRRGRLLPALAVALAGALQVLVLMPFTVSSGLLVPAWVVPGLYAVWLVAAVGLVVTAQRRPLWAPLIPLGNALVWFLVMAAGETWLGWTA